MVRKKHATKWTPTQDDVKRHPIQQQEERPALSPPIHELNRARNKRGSPGGKAPVGGSPAVDIDRPSYGDRKSAGLSRLDRNAKLGKPGIDEGLFRDFTDHFMHLFHSSNLITKVFDLGKRNILMYVCVCMCIALYIEFHFLETTWVRFS